jgi:3-hydroxybutyryl-CoA dehydrogenase
MELKDIKTIGILGAGVMGGGIAQTAILAGFNVIVRDLKDEILANMKEVMINGRFGFKGGIDAALKRLSVTTKVEDLKNVDFLLEAIGGGGGRELENKDLKLKVFAEMDKICKKEAVFASNTSMFTIADLAKATNRKDRFLGMHWFSPANVMKAVEVIWTAEVTKDVVQTTCDLTLKLGKTCSVIKDVPGDTGFVGNRLMGVVRREAFKLVQEGIASADDINKVMVGGFNWPVGPLPSGGPSARTGWR